MPPSQAVAGAIVIVAVSALYALWGPSDRFWFDPSIGVVARVRRGRGVEIDVRSVEEITVLWVPYGPRRLIVRAVDGRSIDLAINAGSLGLRESLGGAVRRMPTGVRVSDAARRALEV